MSSLRFVPLSLVAIALSASAASAQTDPKFAYGTKDDAATLEKVADVEWDATGQAGLLLTTGNSRITTLSAGLSASRKANKNKFALEAGAAYARSSIFLAIDADGSGAIDEDEISRPSSTTTNLWLLKGRYDRFLTANNSLYAAAGISADQPAGKELVGNGQVGYSRQLYASARHTVVAEVGYDLSYEDLVVGDGVTIHSVRGFAGYHGDLSEGTVLDGSIEALANLNTLTTAAGEIDTFEDDRVTSKLGVTTKVSSKISLRFAFEARFDNAPAPRPPLGLPYAPGFQPLADELDTRTEVALIATLF